MRFTGKDTTNIDNKCGSCKYYEPLIKKNIIWSRGKCTNTKKCGYRQRTDSCKKYEVNEA
ncbi:MAG: hypothetical protein K0S61_742 [Anaerocolumna sp.]|jgi:hypothetical protein|nr:hypothetical protein [Anaerocolumna sp.]